MKYCKDCGVELDPSMDQCPLCHQPASENDGQKTILQVDKSSLQDNPDNPGRKDKQVNEQEQNRKLFWELTVLVFFSAAIITLLIDLFTSRQITWSKYTVSISLVLLINSSIFSFLRHKPFILFGGSFASIAALLLLLDYFGKSNGWGLKLGIPLLLLIYLYVLYLFLLIKYLKEKGINIIALLLSAAGVFCLGVEVVLDNYFYGNITMGWSVYVLVSSLPVAGILFFVHYRMKKGRELKRLFHL